MTGFGVRSAPWVEQDMVGAFVVVSADATVVSWPNDSLGRATVFRLSSRNPGWLRVSVFNADRVMNTAMALQPKPAGFAAEAAILLQWQHLLWYAIEMRFGGRERR